MRAPDPLLAVWVRVDAPEARWSADEVLTWPPEYEALLTDADVIRRGDNATAVVCDACADGHVEEVVRIESPVGSPVRAYILCPEAGRVAVPFDRLKEWIVEFQGLSTAVAQGLGLAGTIQEVVPARLWLLGRMTVAGKKRAVFFARGATWSDAARVIGPRLDAAGETVLLVPGELPDPDAWPRPPRAVALRHITRLDGRRLAIDRSGVEGAFAAAARTRQLTREELERDFYDTIDGIKAEAATMAEDDSNRPRPNQPEVAKRLGLELRAIQNRVRLLNKHRVAAGERELKWRDIVRGRR